MINQFSFEELSDLLTRDALTRQQTLEKLYNYKFQVINIIQNSLTRSDSIELISDAFMETLLDIDNLAQIGALPSLSTNVLVYIANQVSIKIAKQQRTYLSLDDTWLFEFDKNNNDERKNLEIYQDFFDDIREQLTEKERSLIELLFLENRTTEEVADLLNIPIKVVKHRKQQLLTRIQRILKPQRQPIQLQQIAIQIDSTAVFDLQTAEQFLKQLQFRANESNIKLINFDPQKVLIQIECPLEMADLVVNILKGIQTTYPIVSVSKIIAEINSVNQDFVLSKLILTKQREIIFENYNITIKLQKRLFAIYAFLVVRAEGVKVKERDTNIEILEPVKNTPITQELYKFYYKVDGTGKNLDLRELNMLNAIRDRFSTFSKINRIIREGLSSITAHSKEQYCIKTEAHLSKIPIALQVEAVDTRQIQDWLA
jgi:DNA-directed RNA polymerase specialized sigma24 family protein